MMLHSVSEQPSWFLYQISPIKNDEDEVILFLITFKDISHLKDPIEGLLFILLYRRRRVYAFGRLWNKKYVTDIQN